jgi:hypothetical protein
VLHLDLIVLGFRQRDVFLSRANRLGQHEVLEARRGKDEHQTDDVASDVELLRIYKSSFIRGHSWAGWDPVTLNAAFALVLFASLAAVLV